MLHVLLPKSSSGMWHLYGAETDPMSLNVITGTLLKDHCNIIVTKYFFEYMISYKIIYRIYLIILKVKKSMLILNYIWFTYYMLV